MDDAEKLKKYESLNFLGKLVNPKILCDIVYGQLDPFNWKPYCPLHYESDLVDAIFDEDSQELNETLEPEIRENPE